MFNKKKSYSTSEQSINTKSVESLQNTGEDKDSKPVVEISSPVKHNPYLGFAYTLITSLLFTLTSVFVKKLDYISPGHLSLIRNASALAGSLPIAVYSGREIIGPKIYRKKLVIRGFLGATALYMNLTAYRYLPLAEAAVIMSTTPALTTILACIYLKEACGLVQGFALGLTFAGVLLSVRLPELLNSSNSNRFDYFYVGGLASAVTCVIFLSVTLVTLRKMKDIHFSVSLLYFGAFGMIENGVINIATGTFVQPQCGLDQILVMLISILGFVASCTLTLAVQKEAVGIVSVLRAALDIIVALIFQIIFFDQEPDLYNIGGASLVLIAVTVMGIRNWLITLPEESRTRKRFKYLLL